MPISDADAPAVLKNIVVGADFSPASDAALLYSLGIARRNKGQVWIVHVIGDTFFSAETQQRAIDDAWREGHRRMTEHFITGKLDGVQAKLLVEQGSISEVLERTVSERKADLLVVGTRGRSRLGKLLLGSTAESIFRQATCPVLTVGPRTTTDIPSDGPRKVLFCTGFSAHSLAAGGLALRITEQQGAELILLHIGPETETSRDAYKRTAMARLASLIPSETKLDMTPKLLVEFGPTSDRILSVAAQQKPHLIVLGVRQPEGFARRVRWATAYDVVANAPCPVLTVRTTDQGR